MISVHIIYIQVSSVPNEFVLSLTNNVHSVFVFVLAHKSLSNHKLIKYLIRRISPATDEYGKSIHDLRGFIGREELSIKYA